MPDEFPASQDLNSIALPWWHAGCSVVPIRPTGRKQPDREWKPLQQERLPYEDVSTWPNGHGVAVICGSISSNLEMLELEADWTDGESLSAIRAAMTSETADLWDVLCTSGYTEWSPKAGLHLLYRISDHPVPPNTKVASKFQPLETVKLITKAETRGEGGYVIVAPSPVTCHEWSGRPGATGWEAITGTPADILTITWEQREAIVRAVRSALDETPAAEPVAPRRPLALRPPGQLSPMEDFNSRVDWADILEPEGWTLHSRNGAGLERLWTRPGKKRTDGHSASTDYMGKPGLYVWSSSAGFPIEEPLTKFYVYAHYRHHGDMVVAARELRARGFGSPLEPRHDTFMGTPEEETAVSEMPTQSTVATTDQGSLRLTTLTEYGMHDLMMAQLKGRFFYLPLRRKWIAWDGRVWVIDYEAVRTRRAIMTVIRGLHAEAVASGIESRVKFAEKQMTNAKLNSTLSMLQLMFADVNEFDVDPNLLNVGNGLLNLTTMELQPHKAEHMVTKIMGADYDPNATAPRFRKYLDEVLPDPEMQEFLQKAAGYTLLGMPVERALVILHGDRHTGKSKFIETMNIVMGTYGATAAASLFQAKRDNNSGPSNDLNDLRGARLASVSELDYAIRMDEALVKRLTGFDSITSRGLYEENQTWMPKCVIWLATNHIFKINSNDGAIWDRMKIVPFNQTITREMRDPLLLVQLGQEAAGIFNWMLEGLAKYRAEGLDAPDAITEIVQNHREEQDTVLQFIRESVADGTLKEGDAESTRSKLMHDMYFAWCKDNNIRFPVKQNTFTQRWHSLGRETKRSNGFDYYLGVSRNMDHIPNALTAADFMSD